MKNLNTTENLKIDTILRVYKKGFGYGLLTVIDINRYFIAALCPEELYDRVSAGETLDAYLWVEKIASYEFKLRVTGKIISPRILAFEHTTEISFSTERKCLKAKVCIPVSFFPLPLNTSEKSFYTEEIVYAKGTIIELGDREAVLEYDDIVQVDFLLKGRLPLNGEDVDFTARIVSCETGRRPQRYSIEYIGMSDKERTKILDYVFMTYRE